MRALGKVLPLVALSSAALASAHCTAPSPPPAKPGVEVTSPSAPLPSTEPSPAVASSATPPSPSASAAPAPSPPPVVSPGVACLVSGDGAPFEDDCKHRVIAVSEERVGGARIADVSPRDVKMGWGFFVDAGRAYVRAESAGVSVVGYAPGEHEDFVLRHDAVAIEGHVWLDAGAGVRVQHAKGGKADVALSRDLPGTDAFVANVACDELAWSRPGPRPPGPPAPASSRDVRPKGRSLSLHLTPGGTGRTLTSRTHDPLPLSLAVQEERGRFARVLFETDDARFDVWVPLGQVESGGAGAAMDFGSCGGIADHGALRLADLPAEAHPRVGATPGSALERAGVTIAAGTRLILGEERDGMVAVTAFGSSIWAPDGQSFWLPKGQVTPLAEKRSKP